MKGDEVKTTAEKAEVDRYFPGIKKANSGIRSQATGGLSATQHAFLCRVDIFLQFWQLLPQFGAVLARRRSFHQSAKSRQIRKAVRRTRPFHVVSQNSHLFKILLCDQLEQARKLVLPRSDVPFGGLFKPHWNVDRQQRRQVLRGYAPF